MKELERLVREHLAERGWDCLRPSDIAKSISIEAAELLELFQWVSLTIEETKADAEKMEELKKELADVFIYALEMAVLLDLDAETIIRHKLEVAAKKYPADLMRSRGGKEPGADDEYWRIKKLHRAGE